MDFKKIDILLKKFYNGDTSIEEEKRLKQFFVSGNIPDKYKSNKEYFDFLKISQKEYNLPKGFDEKIDAIILNGQSKTLMFGKYVKVIFSVAASVALVIYLTVFYQRGNVELTNYNTVDTFENPKEAYNATKKALMLISANINKGTKNLKPLSAFDNKIEKINPLKSFNTEMKKLEKLKTFGVGMNSFGVVTKFSDYQQMIKR